MSWSIGLAAASAVFGGFNAYDEYHANRQIRRDLEKIKDYLKGIDLKLDDVLEQNRQILLALDKLPEQFREILWEVQSEGMLAERYSVIGNIRDNYLLLNGGRRYRIRSEEWIVFSTAMAYLFDHEYRPSKTFALIYVCEVALVITKERALPYVIPRVIEKRDDFIELRKDVLEELFIKLSDLKKRLDNKKYIASHNLTPELKDIDDLEYMKKPDRTISEPYQKEVCRWEWVPGRHVDRRVKKCKFVTKYRDVPDRKFHRARDKYLGGLSFYIEAIKKVVNQIKEVNGVINSFDVYLSRISSQSLILSDIPTLFPSVKLSDNRLNMENLAMYFDEEKNGEVKEPAPLKEGQMDDYSDYLDGCGGDCDSIEGMDIPNDNISFILVKNEHC